MTCMYLPPHMVSPSLSPPSQPLLSNLFHTLSLCTRALAGPWTLNPKLGYISRLIVSLCLEVLAGVKFKQYCLLERKIRYDSLNDLRATYAEWAERAVEATSLPK